MPTSSSLFLALTVIWLSACGGTYEAPVDAYIEPPKPVVPDPVKPSRKESPIKVTVQTFPQTADVVVHVVEIATGQETMTATYDGTARTVSIGQDKPVQDIPDSISSRPDFHKLLQAAVEFAWYTANLGKYDSKSLLSNGENDHVYQKADLGPARNCNEYKFRGDSKCTVPNWANGILDEVCTTCVSGTCNTCVPDSACLAHDSCYYNVPESECQYSIGRNPSRTKLNCDDSFQNNASTLCGSSCAFAYGLGVRIGGGSSWQPATPCSDSKEGSGTLGQNFCGKSAEKSCCATLRKDPTCDGRTGGASQCACFECWKAIPPELTIEATSCFQDSISGQFKIIANGTAEGPVGIQMRTMSNGKATSTTCGDWTSELEGCSRGIGQSPAFSWRSEFIFTPENGSLDSEFKLTVFKDDLVVEASKTISCKDASNSEFDGIYTSSEGNEYERGEIRGTSATMLHTFSTSSGGGSFQWTGTLSPHPQYAHVANINGQGTIQNRGSRQFTLEESTVETYDDGSAKLCWTATDPANPATGGPSKIGGCSFRDDP